MNWGYIVFGDWGREVMGARMGGGALQPVSRTHDDIKWGCDGVERCCLHENALPLSVQASLCVQLHTVTPYPHSSPSHFNFTESVFNASYLCFHLREWAINTQKHSQVISYWLGYWILHLVLACSYVLDFCSFLQWLSGTVYLALPSFAVANSETYVPVIPCFSLIPCHHLPNHITLSLPMLTELLSSRLWYSAV